MKTIRELRNILRFYPQEINSRVSHFSELRKDGKIDFEVFLPSLNINLQRPLVWSLLQKQELIWSILMKRHIPRMAMFFDTKDTYQVIDGKQRLSAMLDFYDNKFKLNTSKGLLLFSELPKDYQTVIGGYFFSYYVVNEDYGNKITDSEKVEWFKFINFAGTPQDKKHMDKLTL